MLVTSRRQFIKLSMQTTGAAFAMTALSSCIRLAMAGSSTTDDEFLWLEELQGKRSLQWVQNENQRTMAHFARSQDFLRIEREVLDNLNKDSQIPWVRKYGNYYYNFWQDPANPQGLLRRTTLDEYRKVRPVWETVLDIDVLDKAEDKEWIFTGVQPLAPECRYCLIYLSPDGGDTTEIREFDLVNKCFVKEGFNVPVAKSQASWIDQDTLLIATDFGPDSMTRSGYGRIVKRWRRGQSLRIAETLYEAQYEDVEVFAYQSGTPGFERIFIGRMTDFWRSEYFLLTQGEQLIKIDIPADAELDTHREWMLIRLTSDWEVGGKKYLAGALLAANFDDYLAGKRELQLLFTPTVESGLSNYSKTRDYLILSILNNVVNRLEVLIPQDGYWQRRPLDRPADMSIISVDSIDEESNAYFLTVSGFLQPTSLYAGNLDSGEVTLLKQESQNFDVSGYQVSQHFVRSRDGTRVPYFQIASNELRLDGGTPTQLYGYGGFSVSLLPDYLDETVLTWLERGGVYVVANIRGGGEYGPAWHKAALRQNRHRSFEDFVAVAEDLIARKVTSSPHLGIRGESNGGLLVGNMLTLYPQLFGCIVCGVPLLDMKRYTQLSAGASWIAEFGDPDKPEQWAYIKTFSPYHNIKSQITYPPVLFYTSTSDDRVNPAHARKMAARMQAMGHQQVYFYENTKGGHDVAVDKQQTAFISALVSEFMWSHLR